MNEAKHSRIRGSSSKPLWAARPRPAWRGKMQQAGPVNLSATAKVETHVQAPPPPPKHQLAMELAHPALLYHCRRPLLRGRQSCNN